jgi:hypothetical protein
VLESRAVAMSAAVSLPAAARASTSWQAPRVTCEDESGSQIDVEKAHGYDQQLDNQQEELLWVLLTLSSSAKGPTAGRGTGASAFRYKWWAMLVQCVFSLLQRACILVSRSGMRRMAQIITGVL